MGIDRFDGSSEEPTHNADAGPRRDTGPSGDARPSGEGPQPGDDPRPGDPTPDRSPRESPGTADTETKRSETRTRDEYADHVRPLGSPPIEEDSRKHSTAAPTHSERGRSEATQLEEERPASPQEDRQLESPTRVPSELEGSAEKPSSPEDAPARLANPVDAHDDEDSQAFERGRELNPDVDTPEVRSENRGPREERTNDDGPSGAQDDHLGEPDNDAAKDQPNHLTDREWAEHLDEVRDGLDTARKAGLRTTQLHTVDGKGQIWSEARDLRHEAILEEFYAKAADVPCDHKAIMAGGLGGAGKTTVLTGQAGIDLKQYLMINPDDFKEEMARRGMLPDIEGLSPMEASDLAHEESSYLAKRLARRAEAEGKNLIWDITMSSQKSTENRIGDLHEAGYAQLDGIFVDIPIELSVKRTEERHRADHEKYRAGENLGGRFVPPEVIRSQSDTEWSSQNRKTYEAVKHDLSSWAIYDNSVDGRQAALIESSRRRHAV